MKYFAYGSNMNEPQMSNRCSGAISSGIARLDGYKFALDYKGYATVLESATDYVWGVLWEISDDHKENLDIAEGVRNGAYKALNILVEQDNVKIDALIYISLRKPNEGNRQLGYEKKVIEGAVKWNLPNSYIKKLAICFSQTKW